jgi:phosphoribosylanthranilate isomerase
MAGLPGGDRDDPRRHTGPQMIRIKICGLTRMEDALAAADSGADMIGFVFAPSPRAAEPTTVREISRRLSRSHPGVLRVGVFAAAPADEIARVAERAEVTHVQVHGARPEAMSARWPWIEAVSVAVPEDLLRIAADGETNGTMSYPVIPWAVLIEPHDPQRAGGTGRTFPWEWIGPLVARRNVIVAGGLDAERVGALIEKVRPFGVDASSRLESAPGIKDPQKVRAFIAAVRRCEMEKR